MQNWCLRVTLSIMFKPKRALTNSSQFDVLGLRMCCLIKDTFCFTSAKNVKIEACFPETFSNFLYYLHVQWRKWRQRLLTFTVLQDVGSKSSLVPHVGGILAVFLLDHALQCVIQLCSYPQRLPDRTEGRRERSSQRRKTWQWRATSTGIYSKY